MHLQVNLGHVKTSVRHCERFCYSSMGLLSPLALLTLSSVTQVLYCPFISEAVWHWKWIRVSWQCSVCQSLLWMESHRGEKGGRGMVGWWWWRKSYFYSPPSRRYPLLLCALCTNILGKLLDVCMHSFVHVCVRGVCMKDWCWPKYLPSCIRLGTHWARERGGEKGGRADATDRDAYQ